MKQWTILAVACSAICSGFLFAQAPSIPFGLGGLAGVVTNEVPELPPIVIMGEPEYAETIQGPFLPPIQGTKINAGKKTSVIDLDELPKISNNNYRQALSKTPGLLLSEETSPLLSIGYRGLPPHRTQFTQVLKDGLPIHADMFGYPESYYTPPLDTVDRVEFIRGGAALMYGPQPGGSLTYVTHRPRADQAFSLRSQHIFGNDSLYSTFNSVDGTVGRLGYYAYLHHRQTDGFRKANSEVDLFAASANLVLDAQTDSRWILNFDGYAEEHGEPGGLTFETGPNAVNYTQNRDAASRLFDRFRLKRHFASLSWEKEFNQATQLSIQAWGGYYSRFSKRQRGGGFGTLASGPAANSNSIELQEFYTEGIESRLRHDWVLGESTHTFAGGFMVYHTDSPRVDKRGARPEADDGEVRNRSEREVFYSPVFFENRFVFGPWSITPGVRLENIHQSVAETVNLDKSARGTPLGDQSEFRFVPLLGLGLEYEVLPALHIFGNVSEAYRPKIFTDAVPTGPNSFVNEDLDEGTSWQYEIGFRGQPRSYLSWDTSLFWMDLDNQIGTVAVPGGTSLKNVGRAIHKGWETAIDLDLIGLYDAIQETDLADSLGRLSWYANFMLLDAQFVSGPQEGNQPQYAGDYLVRTGLIYRWKARGKVGLLGTFVDDHFADDANTPHFRVPSHMTWDLTFEWKLDKDRITVLGGINNLFEEDYYARIRGDGIDPAYRRNYYVGLSFAF